MTITLTESERIILNGTLVNKLASVDADINNYEVYSKLSPAAKEWLKGIRLHLANIKAKLDV